MITREFIEEKMTGCLKLTDDFPTDQDIFDCFFDGPHNIYTIENDAGFLCVQESDDYAYVSFAWYDRTYKARKQMIALGHQLYRAYTEKLGLPIYYSGKSNFFKHHCIEIEPDLWQFVL